MDAGAAIESEALPARPRVFISYASADRARVEPLAAALRQAGYDPWWDTAIEGGAAFARAIETALGEARAVVVGWSKASIESDWVRDEAAWARDHHRLVPLSFDGTEPPLGFRQYQTVDFTQWNGRAEAPAFLRLTRAIGALSGVAERGGAEPATPPPTPRATRWGWIAAALAAVALFAAAALFGWRALAPAPPAQRPAIAVLPFADMSAGGRNVYFAEGVAEEILNSLARDRRLKVLGRTSSWALRERAGDLAYIRDTLGVGHLLEGSVRQSGGQLRVSVRLIDTADGAEQWTEAFDRPTGDIFAIQDEIGQAVAARLAGDLGHAPSRAAQRTSAPVYRDYLIAKQLIRTREPPALERARAMMLAATRTDPNYAPAWAMLSVATALLSDAQYGSIPELRAAALARAAGTRAAAIDPRLAEAHWALGLNTVIRYDVAGAIPALRRAVALEPQSAAIRSTLASAYYTDFQVRAALREAERVAEADPLWRVPVVNLAISHERANDNAAAHRVAARFRAISPDAADAAYVDGRTALATGAWANAVARFDQTLRANVNVGQAREYRFEALATMFAFERIRSAPEAATVLGPLLPFFTGDPLRALPRLLAAGVTVWDDNLQGQEIARALTATGRERELARLFESRFPDPALFASAPSRHPVTAALVARALVADGRDDAARTLRALARAHLKRWEADGLAPSENARTWATLSLGENDRPAALATLEAGLRSDWVDLCEGPVWIGAWPPFATLRGEPRFETVLATCRARIDEQRRRAGIEPAKLP